VGVICELKSQTAAGKALLVCLNFCAVKIEQDSFYEKGFPFSNTMACQLLNHFTDREPKSNWSQRKVMAASKHRRKIRYAVVGLGHIAQVAVLPAFAHARVNSQLTALVSDDPQKLKTLGRRYHVDHLFSYEEYKDCLRSGAIDAVFIALPNHLHAEYSIAAARAGIHVLCEKPMAVTEKDCWAMTRAADHAGIKLMIAYRLHFEEANMTAVRLVRSGKLGDPRFFASSFSMQVRPENIRTDKEKGGGTLYDIGIYCINAALSFQGRTERGFCFQQQQQKGRALQRNR
jgi:predicted dehydrogenase